MHLTPRSACWLGLALMAGACNESRSGRVAIDDRSDAGRGSDGGGLGGGDDDDGVGDDDDQAEEEVSRLRLARFTSAPTTYALVGERYTYRPRSNGVALTEFSLAEAPAGMAIARGQIEWTPTTQQSSSGSHRVVVRGKDGARTIEQSFKLTVATSTQVARGMVSSGSGGMVGVQDGTLSSAGVNVARGGLAAGKELTISELSAAPTTPNMVGASRAVRFGPGGTVFGSPATITLPLPGNSQISEETLSAYVWNPEGKWQRVQVLSLDRTNRVMIARARHFSIYVAAQSRLALRTRLSKAAASTACEGGVSAYAEVTSGLETATLSSVNNLPSELIPAGLDPSQAPITSLLGPGFKGSLQVVHVFDLVEPHDGAELAIDQRMLTTTGYFPGDGTLKITHADALGNELGSAEFTDLFGAVDEISARLRGSAFAGNFRVTPNASQAIAARVHVAYFEDDATHDPIDVDALGLGATERGPVMLDSGEIGDDVDCDGLRDAFDPRDDRTHARIEAEPSAARTLMTNESLRLRATLIDGPTGASSSWSVLGPEGGTADALSELQDAPDARTFAAKEPGQYAVLVRYASGQQVVESQFTIDVIEPNPLGRPTCVPSKPLQTGRVGEPVALAAVLADPETQVSSLRARWGLASGGATPQLTDDPALVPHGTFALLTPTEATTYRIGCQAYDGARWGEVATVEVPVVASGVNRPPEALTVTPAPTRLTEGDELTLQAFARDPDGDALSYEWEPSGPLTLQRLPDDPTGASRRVSATRPGPATLTVRASDGTAREELTLSLQVEARGMADAGTSTIDAGPQIDSGIQNDSDAEVEEE